MSKNVLQLCPKSACKKHLYGNSNQMECDYILVSQETPELYSLIEFTKNHKGIENELLEYAKKIIKEEQK